MIPLNPLPGNILGLRVHPFCRRVLQCFTMGRNHDGAKNLGFGFAAVRSRKVL